MAIDAGSVVLNVVPSTATFATALRGQLAGGAATSRMRKVGLVAGAALGVGLTVAVGGAIAAFKVGEQFDDAFDTIRIGTGATGKALEKLKGDFRAVFGSVPTDMKSASTAIADLNTRLGLTGKPLQEVSKRVLELSRLTGEDLNSIIPATTRLLGDWGVKTAEMPAHLDKLFRASQATGIGVADLSQLMVQFGSPLRQLGFSFDFAAAMFANFEKAGVATATLMPGLRFAIKNLSKPTDDLRETMKRLGIDMSEGPEKSLAGVMQAIKDAPTVLEANGIAFDVFGVRAGPDMAAAIREGRFELDDVIATIKDGDETILGAAKATRDWRESWQIITNKGLLLFEPVADRVFGAVSDFLAWLVDTGIPALGRFGDAVRGVADRFGATGLVRSVRGFVTGVLGLFNPGELARSVGEWASGITGAIQRHIRNGDWESVGKVLRFGLVSAFEGVRDTVGNLAADIFALLGEAVGGQVGTWAKGIAGSIKRNIALGDWEGVGRTLGFAISSAFEGIGEVSGRVVRAVGDMLADIDWVEVGKRTAPVMLGVVVGIVDGLLDPTVWYRALLADGRWKTTVPLILTVMFAPARWVGALAKALGRIPFAGRLLAWLVTSINRIGGRIAGAAGKVWQAFTRGFLGSITRGGRGVFRAITKWVDDIVTYVRVVMSEMWDRVLRGAEAFGRQIARPLNVLRALFNRVFDAIARIVGRVWDNVARATARVWATIQGVLVRVLGVISRVVRGAFDGIRRVISVAWQAITRVTQSTWNAIRGVINRALTAIGALIRNALDRIIQLFQAAWRTITRNTSAAWNALRTTITNVSNRVRDIVSGMLTRVRNAFSSAWDAVRTRFNLFRNSFVFAVIGLTNLVLRGFRGLRDKMFALGKQIFTKMADGIKAAVEKVKSAIGGITSLFSGAGGDGYGLGVIGDGTGSLMGVSPTSAVGAAYSALGRPGDVVSGFRPGAITATGNRSYHGMGRALDITPSMAIFNLIRSRFMGRTKELIYSPAGSRQVHNGGSHFYGEPTRGDHWDHIHWAMRRGGRVPGVGADRDTVPAMLSPGEFVLRRAAVDRWGVGLLEQMNAPLRRGPRVDADADLLGVQRLRAGGLVAGFQAGGLVDRRMRYVLAFIDEWRRDHERSFRSVDASAGLRSWLRAQFSKRGTSLADASRKKILRTLQDIRGDQRTRLRRARETRQQRRSMARIRPTANAPAPLNVEGVSRLQSGAVTELAERWKLAWELGITSTRQRLKQLRQLMMRALPWSEEWVELYRERQQVAQQLLDDANAKVEEALSKQAEAFDRLNSLLDERADVMRRIGEAQLRFEERRAELVEARRDAFLSALQPEQRMERVWANSIGVVTRNIRDQVEQFTRWAEGLDLLRSMGLSEGAVGALGLEDFTAESLATVQLWSNATQSEVDALNAAIAARQATASNRAQTEADRMLGGIGDQLLALSRETADEISGLQAEYAKIGMDTGRSYAEALAEGLSSGIPGIVAAAQDAQAAMGGVKVAERSLAGAQKLADKEQPAGTAMSSRRAPLGRLYQTPDDRWYVRFSGPPIKWARAPKSVLPQARKLWGPQVQFPDNKPQNWSDGRWLRDVLGAAWWNKYDLANAAPKSHSSRFARGGNIVAPTMFGIAGESGNERMTITPLSKDMTTPHEKRMEKHAHDELQVLGRIAEAAEHGDVYIDGNVIAGFVGKRADRRARGERIAAGTAVWGRR